MSKKLIPILLFASSILFLSIFSTSCGDEEEGEIDLSTILKPVTFEKGERKLVLSEWTGQTEMNANEMYAKKVYRDTYEDYIRTFTSMLSIDQTDWPTVLSPSALVDSLIFPGSILRGSSFLNNSYEPITFTCDSLYKQNDVWIVFSTYNGYAYTKRRTHIGDWKDHRGFLNYELYKLEGIDPNYKNFNYQYSSENITHQESFNHLMMTHFDRKHVLDVAKWDLSYKPEPATSKPKSYVLLKLQQNIFRTFLETTSDVRYWSNKVKAEECGTHEPVYISEVIHGRLAYFLVETEMDKESVELLLEATVLMTLKNNGTSNLHSDRSKQFRRLFDEKKISVKLVASSKNKVNKIITYADFEAFIKNGTKNELLDSATPIAYDVRQFLKDSKRIEISIPYKESVKALKD